MYLSVVIPVFNEEESLEELNSYIEASLSKLNKPFEIIFIDDGSDDSSLQILKKIEQENQNVKVYSFRKNLGKSHALMLGFQKANAEYIATLDADLQDDPEDLLVLLKILEDKKVDLVIGWRRQRRDSSFKIRSSKIFNILLNKIFNIQLHDINCPVKVFRGSVAKDLQLYGGLHRFIPLMVHEMGYKIVEKDVFHHPRKYGTSKFRGTKIITDIPDLFTVYFLTKYSGRPLHFFGKIGLIPFVIGSFILSYLFILRLLGERIGTRPLLTFGVLLVTFGVQIIMTGLLADLIVNITNKKDIEYPLKYESQK